MKKHIAILLFLVLPVLAQASIFEGSYLNQNGTYLIEISEFNRTVTFNSVSYYADGTAVNWYFEFILPKNHEVQVGEIVSGRVHSIDGYYDCVFDEAAKMKMEADGTVKVHYPLLTYHRETRSVGWSVVSSKCVIDQRNFVTNTLYPIPSISK